MRGHSTYFWNFAWSIFFIHNGGFLTREYRFFFFIYLFSLRSSAFRIRCKKVVANGHAEHNSVTGALIKTQHYFNKT